MPSVIKLVWGRNPRTGRWDGPFPRGWLPAIYKDYRWKVRHPRGGYYWAYASRR